MNMLSSNTPGRRAACLPVGCLGTAWRIEYDVFDVWSFLDRTHPPKPARATVAKFIERFAIAMRVEPELCALGFYDGRKKQFVPFDGANEMGGGEPSPNGYKLMVRVRRVAGAPLTPDDDQWDAIGDICRPFRIEHADNVLPQPRPLYRCPDEEVGWNALAVPPQPFPAFDHIPKLQDTCTDACATAADLRRLLKWLDEQRETHLRRAHKATRLSWEQLAKLKEDNDNAMKALHEALPAGNPRAIDSARRAYFLAEVDSQWRGISLKESFAYE
jgi:hypothetical protein